MIVAFMNAQPLADLQAIARPRGAMRFLEACVAPRSISEAFPAGILERME